jgi:hypothetical protein
VCGELLSILEHCRAATEPGETRIVPSVADGAANLRTEFLRLIARAGLEVWEKPFQNCRSSCECDWLEQFPGRIAAIARWMGHSPTVAMKHYAQVLPHHADGAAADAAEWADPECAHLTRALGTAKSAQNPAQQGAEPGGMERQSEKPEPRNSRKKPHSLRQTEEWKTNRVGATGFEQPPILSGKPGVVIPGGAESGALPADSPALTPNTGPAGGADPLLDLVIEAWPTLTADERLAIIERIASKICALTATPRRRADESAPRSGETNFRRRGTRTAPRQG